MTVIDGVLHKHCGKCKALAAVDSFPKNKSRVDGRQSRCRKCISEMFPIYSAQYAPKKKEGYDRTRKALRLEVLSHYGVNGVPQCHCCGEQHLEFISIDHIEGGGSKHRKEIGGGGKIYAWLKRNNFPQGFRDLCHNCNQALGSYGYCPHQKETSL